MYIQIFLFEAHCEHNNSMINSKWSFTLFIKDLVTEFGGYMDSPGTRKEFNELPVKVKLLMTVWWVANQETFRQVADRFGTTRGNAHYVIMTTCQVIANRLTDFVIWPKKEELSDLSAGFDFPNAIGIIDTTPIEIKQPLQQLAAYTNYKKKTVVKVQAVCDSKNRFIDVSIGWPGSLHDSRIYELSSLSGVIDKKLQGTPYYILGDKGKMINDFIYIKISFLKIYF